VNDCAGSGCTSAQARLLFTPNGSCPPTKPKERAAASEHLHACPSTARQTTSHPHRAPMSGIHAWVGWVCAFPPPSRLEHNRFRCTTQSRTLRAPACQADHVSHHVFGHPAWTAHHLAGMSCQEHRSCMNAHGIISPIESHDKGLQSSVNGPDRSGPMPEGV